jgi:2-polyprenyl-3-methyl-5-hydroxy-6-metoxy-1,4-benzoquinol methylase
MSEQDQFERVAPFYDELMSGVPYIWWVGYLQVLLDKYDASPTKILDVACGTGSVSELLAVDGYEVVGIDISERMIDMAKLKAQQQGFNIRYYAQDVAELNLDETFDLAISFFDSLNYVSDPASLSKGFHRVAAHLEPGSLFIFDLNTEYALANRMFDQELLAKGRPVRYRWRSVFDEATRLCDITMEFWVMEGDKESAFTIVHRQRAYSSDEITEMLDAAGFDLLAVYQSYTLKRPRRNSDRVHFVAKLRGE